MSLQQTYTTSESTAQSQSGSITLTGLTKVDSVTVNTGTVSYTVSGTTVNMTFSGGAVERQQPYSYSYDCSATPSSISVNSTRSGTRANYQQWNGSSWVYYSSTGTEPPSVSYNDGHYSGTEPKTGVNYGTPTYYSAPSNPSVGQIWHNSDTNWTATYAGTAYAIPKTCTGTGYTNYYKYVATINYETNNPPNKSTFANISSSGSTVNNKPMMFINVSDPDATNTIPNAEIQIATDSGFTNIVADAQFGSDAGYGTTTAGWSGIPTTSNIGTITWTPQSSLPIGTLYARVQVRDNSNAWSGWSATQQFTIANAPWTDTVPLDAHGYKAQWLNDIGTVINNELLFRGLSSATWTDGTIDSTIDIKAIHLSERRDQLKTLLNIVGITPTWTDSSLGSAIDKSGQHIIDLRNYCAQT